MRLMLSWIVVPFALVVLAFFAFAQTDPKLDADTPSPEFPAQPSTSSSAIGQPTADLGPGDDAPDFKADTSTGTALRLSDLKGHVSVLVFASDPQAFRNAEAAKDSLSEQGILTYGVYEIPKRNLPALGTRLGLDFPLLGDSNGDLARRFGMYDDDADEIVPGVILIDAKGVIRLVAQGVEPHSESILALVRHVKIKR